MTEVTQSRIDSNWSAIRIELDAPQPSRIERLLRRAGLPSEITRVMVATPALRRAWFVALFLVAAVGLLVAGADRPRDSFFTLAVLAPLVPVIGVAMAYGPSSDPAHEIELATPMRGLRLLLTRAATVQALATLILGLVSLLSPVGTLTALGWLLPSLGVTSVALALMTVLRPSRAALTAGSGWLLVILTVSSRLADRLAALGPPTQSVSLIVTVAALACVHARRDRFDHLPGDGRFATRGRGHQ